MLSAILEYAATKIADELYSAVKDSLLTHTKDAFEAVSKKLTAIQDVTERQVLTPLHAGVQFVRLEMWEEALVEFVRACAAEPLSPVAAGWLAVCLARADRAEDAREYLATSMRLNPFMSVAFVDAILPYQPDARLSWPVVAQWRRRLLPRTTSGKYSIAPAWTDVLSSESAVGVTNLYGSGGSILVRWIAADDLLDGGEPNLTMFAPNGVPVWTKTIKPSDRVDLVTPQLVAISDEREGLKLIDTGSGNVLRLCSRRYFEVAYHPSASRTSQALQKFETAADPPHTAWRLLSERQPGNLGRALAPPFSRGMDRYREELTIPLLGSSSVCRAEVKWRIRARREGGVVAGGIHTFLHADSWIASTVRTVHESTA